MNNDMNNDLISRADLWKKVMSHTYPVDILENEHKVITEILRLIGSAPTALFPLTFRVADKVTDEDIETIKRLMKDYQPQIINFENEWIPTSEMLPDEYDSYLVMWRCLKEDYPDRLFYEICEYYPEEDEWEKIEQAGEAGAEIVAWMQLPERYESKEKEK